MSFWQFIDHFLAFIILGFATVLPTLAALASDFLPVESPYTSIVYYATTAISLLAAGLCPCIPQPPINPLFVLLSFGSVVYTSRVFELVQSGVFFPEQHMLDLGFRVAVDTILFIALERLYAAFLLFFLDKEDWGTFEHIHATITDTLIAIAQIALVIPIVFDGITTIFHGITTIFHGTTTIFHGITFFPHAVTIVSHAISDWFSHSANHWANHWTNEQNAYLNEQQNIQEVSLEIEEIDGELPPPYFKVLLGVLKNHYILTAAETM